MGRKSKGNAQKTLETLDYRHKGAKRKNNPPAPLAGEGTVPAVPKVRYEYSPHLPPVLRFDATGTADKLPQLIAEAGRRPLTEKEQRLLADALRTHEPWLEWAGKRESDSVTRGRGWFEVDPVALHIHERVSSQAIIKVAARQDVQRGLFADPEQSYNEAVQFYQHDIDWTNRLILGDSLLVMSSLARREDLAGKVQTIYIDPPYGVRFGSNFQAELRDRDVKDAESDLTREIETVKAYRDTWSLGVHSYLHYLRDRLLAARELLADSGSLFLQISDENLHRVRGVLDDVFGPEQFCSLVSFQKTGSIAANLLPSTVDYLLWYAKDRVKAKYRQLYVERLSGDPGLDRYDQAQEASGLVRRLTPAELTEAIIDGVQRVQLTSLVSDGASSQPQLFQFRGVSLKPKSNAHWKTTSDGLRRLASAERIEFQGERPRYLRRLEDFRVLPLSDRWEGVQSGSANLFVVQTASQVIERCLLMTTEPGDLVLDPTCGSGTTAFVAEEWGRRWITIDTSRVAIAIARQRLITAKYEYYDLRDASKGVGGGLKYKTVPHITLKSIAQNTNLDPIFAKHEPILDQALSAANAALGRVGAEIRMRLPEKLLAKQKAEGKKAITDADRRRWELPKSGKWAHWEVPFDTDPDWPKELQDAVTDYRRAWRARMDEVNACISANAEQEELVDQPAVVRGVVRVSGPFTVEAVQPPELSLDAAGFAGEPSGLTAGFDVSPEAGTTEVQNTLAYLRQMFKLLKMDGVRFPNNKQMQWSRLDPLFESGRPDEFHAEGRWVPEGEVDDDAQGTAKVGLVFGPQYGPVTASMVEHVIRPAGRRYDDLVIAAFSFDGPAQDAIRGASHPRLRIHMAHIRPDVNPAMAGLLKEQPGSQLFTVFGQPRASVKKMGSEYVVSMEGVDIYNPVENVVYATNAEKVAAWFLDGDYDGRTFCITQAFFPDSTAWEKLAKALGGVVDPESFAAFSGTTSLPFPAGKHRRVAVKVIDPRGNEVMTTLALPE